MEVIYFLAKGKRAKRGRGKYAFMVLRLSHEDYERYVKQRLNGGLVLRQKGILKLSQGTFVIFEGFLDELENIQWNIEETLEIKSKIKNKEITSYERLLTRKH